MLPLMIASGRPRPMSVAYGSSSASVQVFVTSTTAKSVLAAALPRPGKCLSVARTPAAWRPRISASAIAATIEGSAEKLRPRAPIAGLFGLTLTSTTGARSRSMPAAAIVLPIARPAARATAGSSVAPMAASVFVAGKPLAGLSRDTLPPSWSMAMRSGLVAAARSEAISAASWRGDAMFRLPPVSWSRSNRITPPSPPARATAIGSPGPISSPRKPTISIRAIRTRKGTGVALGDGVEGGGLGVALGAGLGPGGVGAGVAPAVPERGPETVVTPHAASAAAIDPAAMARSIARRVMTASFVTRQR